MIKQVLGFVAQDCLDFAVSARHRLYFATDCDVRADVPGSATAKVGDRYNGVYLMEGNSTRIRGLGMLFLSLATASVGFAQTSLSIDEAVQRAKERNGTVQSAILNYRAAQKTARRAYGAFLPTVTPSASQEFGSSEIFTGPARGTTEINNSTLALDVNWRILDDGRRQDNFDRATSGARSAEFSSLQTLRTTLFGVHQRFYDALRTQELLRVQNDNLKRAEVILEQTKFRANPPIEDIPKKDILQAEADFQNARVNVLTSQNRVATSAADLKAVLAWDEQALPELVKPTPQQLPQLDMTLQQAIVLGLESRADLAATRERLRAQQLNIRTAKRDAFIQYSLDAGYRRVFVEDPFQRAALTFSASFPLYDGGQTQIAVETERLNLAALEASLEQDERQVRAEVESAFTEYGLNRLRFEAAEAAFRAAKVNYDAAVESQKEGAGNLLQVLTAQVSLTTAESNVVEATYDMLISDVRLRLVTGQSVPGE